MPRCGSRRLAQRGATREPAARGGRREERGAPWLCKALKMKNSTVEYGIRLQFGFAKVAQQLGSVGLRLVVMKKEFHCICIFPTLRIARAAILFPEARRRIAACNSFPKEKSILVLRGGPLPPRDPTLL